MGPLPPPPLSSERLRVFVVVAKSGGFSPAARALGLTQPSVSQAVMLLEREIGERLFSRSGRNVFLTEAGRLLLPMAERVLDDIAAARTAVADLGELQIGQLVVGASDTFSLYLLPDVLRAFRERYPGVDLRLDNRPSPAIAERALRREVDVGVVSLPLPPLAEPGLGTQALVPIPDVLVMPPWHPLAQRKRVRLDALAGESLLMLDRTTATRAYLDKALSVLPRPPRVAMEMNSVEVQKRLVELGFGLAIVPALAVAHEVRTKSLAVAQLSGLGPPRHAGLVWAGAEPRGPAARAFMELARAMLGKRG